MSTRAFFLNSDAGAIYGEEEINALGTITLDPGVINTVAVDWDAWKTAGDLKVGQRGAGANMSVDVSAGWGLVQTTRNTKVFNIFVQNVAIQNLVVAANSSGSNRVDAVIARVSRSADPNTLTNNVMTLEVVTGSGVSALTDGAITSAIGGDDFIRLANVTVANGASSITNANITDTRVAAKTSKGIQMAPETLHFRTVSAEPASPVEGEFWFNNVTHTLNFFNGSNIIQLGGSAGVYNPLIVRAQSTPGMTLAVSSGQVRFSRTPVNYAGGSSGTFTAPANVNEKRIDLLGINAAGSLVIVQGSATVGVPTVPEYPITIYVLAEVYLRYGMTSIKDLDDTTNGYISRDARALFMPSAPTALMAEAVTSGDLLAITPENGGGLKKFRGLQGSLTATNRDLGSYIHDQDNVYVSIYMSSADVRIRTSTLTGSVLTSAATATVAATTKSTPKLFKVTDGLYLVTYQDASSYNSYVAAVTISGTTISVGTPITDNAIAAGTAPLGHGIMVLSSTTAIWLFGNQYSSSYTSAMRHLTLSGNAITAGTKVTQSIENSPIGTQQLRYNGTHYGIAACGNGTYDLNFYKFVLSGTTFTYNSTEVLNNGTSNTNANAPMACLYDPLYGNFDVTLMNSALYVNSIAIAGAGVNAASIIVKDGFLYLFTANTSSNQGVAFKLNPTSMAIILSKSIQHTIAQAYVTRHASNGGLVFSRDGGSAAAVSLDLFDQDQIIDIADKNYVLGETKWVTPMMEGSVSLVIGRPYYAPVSGQAPTLDATYALLGKAISATKILRA